MVARYGRLCTPSITIHSDTAGSWKPRSKPMEIIAIDNSVSSTASCHTTRSTWAKSAGSAHLGVRRKGLLLVRSPVHTALPTVWVSDKPATEAAKAPLKPEPTLGGYSSRVLISLVANNAIAAADKAGIGTST